MNTALSMSAVAGFNERSYGEFFSRITGQEPYSYQVKVGRLLSEGKNILLRAPTGAGKTWAVIVPFFFVEWTARPTRLIYALPLRTLAQSIYQEALGAAEQLGLPVQSQRDMRGREIVAPFVTLQTGEHPDDPFFDRGNVIVTTYDQVLSGLLDGPYGLSNRLHNINAAAIAGSLLVFDEFHLMEPQRAFLTAVAGLHLFRDLCQSVWMTATATQPLEDLLHESLATQSVPATADENHELLASLPSVTRVTRQLVWEKDHICVDSVLRVHTKRSVVILNTVARAQEMYGQLRDRVNCKVTRLILLHSRFFKEDRSEKEKQLRLLFGKNAQQGAILVATQVVEAGLDISCEHLHTELCPMNALIQRAGRCARFDGETGTVHVYALPPNNRAWLPYGDGSREFITITKTRSLMEEIKQEQSTILDPNVATAWVQAVHAEDDAQALREGWRARVSESLRRINQSAIIRDPKRISDLIRNDDGDQIRVIIAQPPNRPDSPGKLESLALSRWSLSRLLRDDCRGIGWFWDGSDDEPRWKPLQAAADLKLTYAVCLVPTIASYDSAFGLRLNREGNQISPKREEPQRPGYAPLKRESWSDHAKRVAEEAARRLEREGGNDGMLHQGFRRRYGLDTTAIKSAVRTCALLHDLGKLQQSWQQWAEAAQKARDANYQHLVPLAHTDFDRDNRQDREQQLNLGFSRPPHAAASAYYGVLFVAKMLESNVPLTALDQLASACVAALLAHHGAWLPSSQQIDLNISGLYPGSANIIAELLAQEVGQSVLHKLESQVDKRGFVERWLAPSTAIDNLEGWWPVVAYLTRTLRLSDQRATSEGGAE